MKRKVLLINFLCVCSLVFAQDTLKVSTEQGTFTPPQYSTAYDDVFLNKKDTKWLLRVDALDFLLHLYNNDETDFRAVGRLPHFSVAFERKIKQNMSLNFGLHITP